MSLTLGKLHGAIPLLDVALPSLVELHFACCVFSSTGFKTPEVFPRSPIAHLLIYYTFATHLWDWTSSATLWPANASYSPSSTRITIGLQA